MFAAQVSGCILLPSRVATLGEVPLADIWFFAIKENLKTVVVCCVKVLKRVLAALLGSGVVARDNLNVSQTVDGVVVIDCLASSIISRKLLLYYHRKRYAVGLIKGVGNIRYITNREVVVTAIFKQGGNSLSLSIKGGNVEDISSVNQTVSAVWKKYRLKESVLKVVVNLVNNIRLALLERVGNLCPLAAIGSIYAVVNIG